MPKRARCPHCDRLFSRDVIDNHIPRCRLRNMETRTVVVENQIVVVDGNNVAHHMSSKGIPKAQNLILAYRSLKSTGFEPIFVVSAALIHKIDRPTILNEFMLSANVVEASRGTSDDLRIIQLSKELGSDIISNDRFLDWIDRFPWISSRLKRYRMTPSGLILV
ncbi:MAG: hypothetical protein ACFFE3_07530 [Candidatus Thorarchaeota archaeon]